MPMKIAGKIVLPDMRQIALVGKTVLTLNPGDTLLEITSVSGTDASLVQLYPHTTEGRLLWIWNNSGATARLGFTPLEPEYRVTAYSLPYQSMINGRVFGFRYYVDGGLPGSVWPQWMQL